MKCVLNWITASYTEETDNKPDDINKHVYDNKGVVLKVFKPPRG
jgi:hypothetical protein